MKLPYYLKYRLQHRIASMCDDGVPRPLARRVAKAEMKARAKAAKVHGSAAALDAKFVLIPNAGGETFRMILVGGT